MVHTSSIKHTTIGDNDTHDLTDEVAAAVKQSGVQNGIVTVFVPGSTAGVTAIEFEPGMIRDLDEFLERLVPADAAYNHNHGGDSNGHAHIRSAFIGPSLTVPIVEGHLLLGTWQQIVLIDFDDRTRERQVVVQTVGE